MNLNEIKKLYYGLKAIEDLAKKIHRLNEVNCVRGLSKRQERRYKMLKDLIIQSAAELGLKVKIQGDPRAAAVKLYFNNEDESGLWF